MKGRYEDMTGYKKILENMVELEVSRFITKQSGSRFASFATCVDGVTLSTENKKLGHPTFELEMNVPADRCSVMCHNYLITGYIDDYGSVVVCAVEFVRDIKKAGEDDYKTIHEFIHGEELKTFRFDR